MAKRPLTINQNIVTVGVPSSPLKDLYFYLMKGTWAGLITLMASAYLVANLVFAVLYLLGGDCIAGAQPNSFTDAFFFSVQTISTIGYGTLTPKTPYANTLVAIEAIVGLMGFAIVTGLMFTKFARPQANVIFSKNVLLTEYNHQPCLMFRVANARGNDVVEASMRVCVLKPEESSEGFTMRRLHDLRLQRENTPVFTMSWLAIHVIDESSPLHGENLQSMIDKNMIVIVSFSGIDGTFAQMVHTRHIYQPQDIASGHRFADVISGRDDGKVQFNFAHFHQIEPANRPR